MIGVWFLLFVGILGGSFALGGQTQESFAIPGTESQAALDRLDAVFPSVAGASAQAVVEVPAGASVNDATYKAAIEKMDTALGRIHGVDSVVSPFSKYAGSSISTDGTMARSQIQFTGASTDVTPKTLDQVKATAKIGEDAGLTVAFGGQVFSDNTFGITITEVFGVIFAGVVLLITFGSLIAAGMPLLSALVGVGIVTGGISAISAFTTVSSSAPLLALMIGLAVGIDYSLFILSRHRNQLANGEDPEESAATAVGTAGSAVVFAGVTVIIALLGLLVVGIPFLSVMGVGAAFAVLVAIGVATTLVPALLGLAKGRLRPKEGSRAWKRATVHAEGSKPTLGLRWVRGVMKRPVLATLAVVAVLGTLAIPALSLDLNLPDGASEPKGSTQRQAYEMIDRGFGPGYNGPLIVAVDITQTTNIQSDLDAISARLKTLDDVAYVSQGLPDAGLDTAIIQVIPSSAPNATETKDLVQSIRDLQPSIKAQYDTPISVTGATAVGIDISNRLSAALLPFGAIVVGLSIILLMMVCPLGAGADQGGRRLPALGARVVRRRGRGVPVGLALERVQRGESGAHPELHADPVDGRAVRVGDGLRGVPRLRHARGVRARRQREEGRGGGLRQRRPCGHGRRPHHVLRLHRLRARGLGHDQTDRARAGDRRRVRRLPGADDAGARRHDPARPRGLVDAEVAAAPAAQHGHRGRAAARAPRGRGVGGGPAGCRDQPRGVHRPARPSTRSARSRSPFPRARSCSPRATSPTAGCSPRHWAAASTRWAGARRWRGIHSPRSPRGSPASWRWRMSAASSVESPP